jgi:hypothetical protein
MADECPRVLDRSALPILQATAQGAAEHMRAHHGIELGLIIVDTMAAAAVFNDEDDNAECQRAMNVFEALAKKFECLVVAVDHFGKAVETGTRGGSAKESSAYTVLALLGDRELSGAVSNPRMAIRKVRGGPSGNEVPFSVRVVDAGVDQDGKSEATLVIDWKLEGAADRSRKEKLPPSLIVFRDALVEALLGHGSDMRPYPDCPVVRAVDREVVRTEFYKRYPADGETEEAQQASRKTQFKRGLRYAHARKLVGVAVIDQVTMLWMIER